MEQRDTWIGCQKINYSLRQNQKAKNLRLTVYPGGKLVVTKPTNVSQQVVDDFIKQKSDWIFKKIDYCNKIPANSTIKNRQEYKKYKDQALRFVVERINYYNRFYGFNFNQIRIKNQKTRWGSCSDKSNLNFNYKIIFLPSDLADYLIIHELCHLKELNHSKRFWGLVARTIPDYEEKRKKIKSIKLS
jgi:hypothetical protein